MKLYFHNSAGKEAVKAHIDKYPDGKEYEVNITPRKSTRTLSQNRLYWLYIACIIDETGNDRDALHDHFRRKFLPVYYSLLGDEQTEKLTSTTALDTVQFTQYIDRIVAFSSSELGIVLPNPEDRYFEQFYEQYKGFI